MTSRPLALAFLAVAVLAGACGERAEPVGALSPSYPVTVAGAGDSPAVVRAAPRRIVALDPGSAALLEALGAGRHLVGAPAGAAHASAVAAVVRPSGRVDVRAVVRLRPDLIVTSPGVDPLAVDRAQRESGAALYVQPTRSVADVGRAGLELGLLLGDPARARRLAGEMRRAVAEVEARVAGVNPVTVFVDIGFFATVPEQSLLGDLVRRARGRSIAGPDTGLTPFPLARLVELDPEVYLATSDSGVTLALLQRHPVARRLTAVQEGRFAVLPADLVTAPGPRVAEALETVARALHPDAF